MTGSREAGILFALHIHNDCETPACARMETNMIAKKGSEPRLTPSDDSIMELSLMMSRRQFEALEERARTEGISVAQFLRRLIEDAVFEEFPLGQPD